MLKGLLGHLFRTPRRAPQSLRATFDALLQADQCESALSLALQARARDPVSREALLLVGRAHQKLHQPERALECYEAARRLDPDDAELHDFRGSMLEEIGRLPDALADYDRALALRPDFPLAAYHRALARLSTGDFERGWDGYELRRLSAGFATAAAGYARWDGAPLAGRTILVAREQGLGDEIMFASMLPELIAAARHCVVECDPRLVSVFRRSFPAATVFGTAAGGTLPVAAFPAAIDVAIEAGSLAGLLRRTAAKFPRHEGYLRADPRDVERWRKRLAALGPGRKLGLAWTGGVRRTRRELRSIALVRLLPLLRTPGSHYVSLQYAEGATDEIEALRKQHGVTIHHWPEAIEDYDQTAALVCALDLVVSVCTALVHLGGALGRPVWVLAPVCPEWRYGIAGSGMPWYPSVRIFRQARYGDWGPVIEGVAGALAA